MCMFILVLATAGVGWWFYERLNGKIHSVSLEGRGGAETADAFGRKPINILVMGSDGRTSKADCKLGGGCASTGVQTGYGNADVQMVVHISADRSNTTVMSIPRDTMTRIPSCNDEETHASTAGYYGQINSALQYGPACQVATTHQLTRIPIDHFIKLDFSGVVKMSDAVGGVAVCVSDNVYDTYSHLKLSKGTHTLKGEAALQFVRARHAFGDGSDLGRTRTQHLFLAALLRKVKSTDLLTHPTTLYSLADAATRALTVDDGLGSIDKLISLARDLNKVPAGRATFTTMQSDPDPDDSNRVVPAPAAEKLFSAIAQDVPLSTGSGKKSGKAPATPSATTVPSSRIAVTVQNGTSITGRASAVAESLIGRGFSSATTASNAPGPAKATTLTYGPGREAEARTVAAALGITGSHLKQGRDSRLTLVIGNDWPRGTGYPNEPTPPASALRNEALADAHVFTADRAASCAEVSRFATVNVNGVSMTPTQAYAAAREVPDSDS
ncbi:LCP family protein [Streptomyces sp. NPDC047028]|uniref:LCP family protein n=1 Tax=Streptomyces sp. NPDC047028 TaxID=3155793 RepID=UPI0033D21C05